MKLLRRLSREHKQESHFEIKTGVNMLGTDYRTIILQIKFRTTEINNVNMLQTENNLKDLRFSRPC
jgi:hypothetical protein